jgi:Ribosomal RNA adenine dimethylase
VADAADRDRRPAVSHQHPGQLHQALLARPGDLDDSRGLGRRLDDVGDDLGDARSIPLPRSTFRVVACPPYGITADLLRLLLSAGPRLAAADLVLQRAAVRKYSEECSQRAPRTHRMTAGLTVPRRAFRPPPHVDSAVLRIRKR